MSKARKEIAVLEERLRQAELGPDAETFEDLLADNAVLVDQTGMPLAVEISETSRGRSSAAR